jgi:hypothetical protein
LLLFAVLVTFDLGRNNITGPIPPEFGDLHNLSKFQLPVLRQGTEILTQTKRRCIPVPDFLNLEDNRLTGSIPSHLEQLYGLSSLELSFNNLYGTIPDRLCESKDLENLSADCVAVSCYCCTDCGNPNARVPTTPPTASPTLQTASPTQAPPPTAKPTTSPTGRLSPSPTSLPTQCQSSIEVEASCVVQGVPFLVDFVNCEALEDDWIGIYPSYVDADDLGMSPVLWVWSCGNQGCRTPVRRGNVTFTEEHVAEGSNGMWPLDESDYKAFLIRRNPGGPYAAHATSEVFEIRKNSC